MPQSKRKAPSATAHKATIKDRAKVLLVTSTMSAEEIANVLLSDVRTIYQAQAELQLADRDSIIGRIERLAEEVRELRLRLARLEGVPADPIARRLQQHRASKP